MKKQTNATDETLVALYAQGNNEAFDILLNSRPMSLEENAA